MADQVDACASVKNAHRQPVTGNIRTRISEPESLKMRNCLAAQFRGSRNQWTRAVNMTHCRGDYIPFVTTSNAYCHVVGKPKSGHRRAQSTVECPPSIRRQKRSALPSASPSAAYYLSRICRPFPAADTRLTSSYILPVSPFVVALCPAPPVSTQTNRPLPCSRFAELPLASTWTTLPHYGLSITC